MRTGAPSPNMLASIAVALVVSSLLGLGLFALIPGEAAEAEVRLDVFETSWPNHVEVQDAGVEQLTDLLAADAELNGTAVARKDRSTIEVRLPASASPDSLTELIAGFVDADSASDIEQLERATTALAQAEQELASAEALEDPEIEGIVTAVNDLRTNQATIQLEASTARSRFVPLGSPRTTDRPSLAAQLVAALIALGFAAALFAARTRTS